MNRLTQKEVDEDRLRTMTAVLVTHICDGKVNHKVQHIRYPEPRVSKSVLRDGNPPSDTDRHPWEKGLKLHVHLDNIPPWLAEHVLAYKMHQNTMNPKESWWRCDRITKAMAALVKGRELPMHAPDPEDVDLGPSVEDENAEAMARRKKMLPLLQRAATNVKSYRPVS